MSATPDTGARGRADRRHVLLITLEALRRDLQFCRSTLMFVADDTVNGPELEAEDVLAKLAALEEVFRKAQTLLENTKLVWDTKEREP